MPPRKAKQNLSTASDEGRAASTTAPNPPMEEAHTPEQDPAKRAVTGITQAQKQVLIDNLQQEVTDRARRLRTQYAQQAQNIRTRLEMRINRIPTALRKRKMQDLIDEHTRKNEPQTAAPLPIQVAKAVVQGAEAAVNKSLKRQSDQISSTEEDEETPTQDLPNPKKRTKTAASTVSTANTKATRTVPRKPVPTVLSPKSHNSRTLPKAPAKAAEKPTTNNARPTSPTKTQLTAPAKTGRTQTTSKRNAPRDNESGRSSDASNTSATTTIVTKNTRGGRVEAGTAINNKKPATGPTKATGTGKKSTTATAKKENMPPATAAGGRSLRKRG